MLAAVALATVAACTGASESPSSRSDGPTESPSPTPSRPAAARAGESRCPLQSGGGPAVSRIARGSQDRPIVRLCFDVRSDRELVRGHESVVYVADERTCEAVFRAWANKPGQTGDTAIQLGNVLVDGRQVQPKVEPGGASDGGPGTLVRVPIPSCAERDDEVRFDIDFQLRLGEGTEERVGTSSEHRIAWFGTAYPLLGWKRGDGWDTQPAVPLFAETAVSETFELSELAVIAPEGDSVLGTGEALEPEPGPEPGTVVHRFRATGENAVRDVAVSVGRFDVSETVVDGVRIRAAVPSSGSTAPSEVWANRTAAAVRELSERFGDFPYDDLWVTVSPDIPSGVEFPGAIQFADVDPAEERNLIPHEVAHQWFYGLVGNDQGQHPWLDEAFATYAESLVVGSERELLSYTAPGVVRHEVGRNVQWYAELEEPSMYGAGVYVQGGRMLLEARQAVGPERWDRLIRKYLKEYAGEIATPASLAEILSDEPAGLRVLREYGALR